MIRSYKNIHKAKLFSYIIFLAILLICSCIITWYYFHSIQFALPVKIYSSGGKPSDLIKKVYGKTPRGRCIIFRYDTINNEFVGFYGFARDIIIVPATSGDINFIVESGKNVYCLSSRLSVPKSDCIGIQKKIIKTQSVISLVDNGIRQEPSFSSMLISVSHWYNVRMAVFILSVILFVLLVFGYRVTLFRSFRKLYCYCLKGLWGTIQLLKRIINFIHNLNLKLLKCVTMVFQRLIHFFQRTLTISGKFLCILKLKTKSNTPTKAAFLKRLIKILQNILLKVTCDWIYRPLFRWVFVIILFFSYYLILIGKVTFTDTSLMHIDERDYQCIAVNFAKGHGIHRMGAIEPFEVYKFDTIQARTFEDGKIWYHTSMHLTKMFPGVFAFFRNPGYPFFLGMVYKIFGIHPVIAKHFQFIFQILVIALLPLLGFLLWGRKGILAGLMAGPFLVNYDFFRATRDLMTESIQPLFLIIFVFSGIYHQKKRSSISSILFGILMGLSFLIKLSYVMLPLIYAGFVIRELYLKRANAIRNAIQVYGIFLLISLPWTIYGSLQVKELKEKWLYAKAIISNRHLNIDDKNKKLSSIYPPLGKQLHLYHEIRNIDRNYLRDSVYHTAVKVGWLIDSSLTTEQKIAIYDHIILDQPDVFLFVSYPVNSIMSVHNEYVLNRDNYHGFPHISNSKSWHTEWEDIDTSFYNRDQMKDASPYLRIANFYLKNPGYILPVIRFKLIDGFDHIVFLWLMVLLCLSRMTLGILETKSRVLSYMILPLVTAGAGILIATGLTGMIFKLSLLLILAFIIVYSRIKAYPKVINFPFIVWLLIMNFFMLSVILVGYNRYNDVLNFIFIIVSIYLVIDYLLVILKGTGFKHTGKSGVC